MPPLWSKSNDQGFIGQLQRQALMKGLRGSCITSKQPPSVQRMDNHFPLNTGLRFSRNDLAASTWSAVSESSDI
jgi:hypothetical protein